MLAYVLLRPALIPWGGSLVNLMEDWSRVIGNLGCTSVVIHRRNFSLTFSVVVIWKQNSQNAISKKIKNVWVFECLSWHLGLNDNSMQVWSSNCCLWKITPQIFVLFFRCFLALDTSFCGVILIEKPSLPPPLRKKSTAARRLIQIPNAMNNISRFRAVKNYPSRNKPLPFPTIRP